MTTLDRQPDTAMTGLHPAHGRLRFVTAASLFDGHDASINIMRRILQSQGAEVIHLAHNRSVDEVVNTAIQEDAHGIAVSSYQGGHVEYFRYMRELLDERGAGHIQVFGGGGGVIVPAEIRELQEAGVIIYSPEDGQRLGLVGMIEDVMRRAAAAARPPAPPLEVLAQGSARELARYISALEDGTLPAEERTRLEAQAAGIGTPVLGITGTGGAGKSSLTDELISRIRLDQHDSKRVAVISIDPSRRKSGGALLGDRIRMNAIDTPQVYMRSLATREAGSEISAALPGVIAACKVAGFDLIIVETSGIGQGDAAITPHVDLSLYVMTPEFGAASQLEKIDMLDFADLVAINKFDRRGAQDAQRDVGKQLQRNREAWEKMPADMPVYGTQASLFNDDGVTALYFGVKDALAERGHSWAEGKLTRPDGKASTRTHEIVPASRARYLAEIAETVRGYHAETEAQAGLAREVQDLRHAQQLSGADLSAQIAEREGQLSPESRQLLEAWPQTQDDYAGDEMVTQVRGREIRTELTTVSLSGLHIPKVALPRLSDHGDLLRFLRAENLPGRFPFTAGVFPFKREGEDPTRMFAGEGDAARTNRRFRLISEGMPAKRLSTAFDSVTLYGQDPDPRPDIYGKVGTSGVSIATLDDMRVLFDGFDLSDPSTSVSMTINGPAPTILAMYLNVAIEKDAAKFAEREGREPTEQERAELRAETLRQVRGTVQADILKEDQGQNTCIFSTEFSLKVMGDIQEYFVQNEVRNFYSVSISGYHIAEAGANPITQLAFTLANGFTYVESYLARGMQIDDFAPNLSFFFSNGMDPEYSVMGRVARRIWAVAMREKYGAAERSQKLKYHVQTSGRSLHAQEMDFNDIRTTLQALIAIYDNTNSLHTNAYDEAITTPSAESVRRALAIQLIINREWGAAKNQNPNQGSFFFEQLTDMVEEAVLAEFERLSERGGVLGAMETGYQRGRIQEESMLYEHRKHDGTLPIIGVNTFLNPNPAEAPELELARGTEEEKQAALQRLQHFQAEHAAEAPAMLERLQQAVLDGENVFAVLMDAVRVCSLGQITNALFEVGGQYRRNM
ncbi:methylmalonyl-CoA mutase, large subunit [Deinococcus proteolyticus MRP]|uniref:Fused isobutyryl-CoA mutase n=1 Tax=Deinococcus proteolyticus (strain ATCC 35074 / DSM 20540 / JCM 6276 / NBRC 101906 / NCIMB 13154 / VKM Ac-1939 / CCM 2703 / MRP) TaxID=693977 RepID=F0RNB8_DEIPM|nr:fused isobutyryl-CoA mutase/GTPase IcmF [Deinococcus proteolyticus]ADY26260.1 methylmalonyl-CoA mutase, large subunit [Deinococcus proteolyticus MRP]